MMPGVASDDFALAAPAAGFQVLQGRSDQTGSDEGPTGGRRGTSGGDRSPGAR